MNFFIDKYDEGFLFSDPYQSSIGKQHSKFTVRNAIVK